MFNKMVTPTGGSGGSNFKTESVSWSDLSGKTTFSVTGLGFLPKQIIVFSNYPTSYYTLMLWDSTRDTTRNYGAYYTTSYMNNGTTLQYGSVSNVTSSGFDIYINNDNTVFGSGLTWVAIG